MDTMTLIVAGLAAAAIIIIAAGVAMSGSGSGMSERLQRYASTPKPGPAKGESQGPISDLIVDLHQWMHAFDPSSLLELDYGGLSALLTWDELDEDHSARDVHEALEALEREEFPRAADVYQGVLSRWAEVGSREAMN